MADVHTIAEFEAMLRAQEYSLHCLDKDLFFYESCGRIGFHLYGPSGVLNASMLAVLILRGPGKPVRMAGGDLPRSLQLKIDPDGWMYFGFEVSNYIMANEPFLTAQMLMMHAQSMVRTKEAIAPYLGSPVAKLISRGKWIAHRAKMKWAALKAA